MSHLTLNEYQIHAAASAFFHPANEPVAGMYEALGLAGETGEVIEKIKKAYRDGGDPEVIRTNIKGELGDVLWYLSQLARKYNLTLEEVATANLEKLASRRSRGVLHGSGDNR